MDGFPIELGFTALKTSKNIDEQIHLLFLDIVLIVNLRAGYAY